MAIPIDLIPGQICHKLPSFLCLGPACDSALVGNRMGFFCKGIKPSESSTRRGEPTERLGLTGKIKLWILTDNSASPVMQNSPERIWMRNWLYHVFILRPHSAMLFQIWITLHLLWKALFFHLIVLVNEGVKILFHSPEGAWRIFSETVSRAFLHARYWCSQSRDWD